MNVSAWVNTTAVGCRSASYQFPLKGRGPQWHPLMGRGGGTHHLVEKGAPGVDRVHRADPGVTEGHAAEIAYHLAVLDGLRQGRESYII